MALLANILTQTHLTKSVLRSKIRRWWKSIASLRQLPRTCFWSKTGDFWRSFRDFWAAEIYTYVFFFKFGIWFSWNMLEPQWLFIRLSRVLVLIFLWLVGIGIVLLELLVGGLEHFLLFHINNQPKWLIFSRGLKPLTRLCWCRFHPQFFVGNFIQGVCEVEQAGLQSHVQKMKQKIFWIWGPQKS